MADTLVFEPSEFRILEDFEFEEEIQRPEELRFYTLDEQLSDYFEKVLPKDRKATKFDLKKIAIQVDRMKGLYSKTIVATDTDYKIDTGRKKITVDWVKPIYSDFSLMTYPFQTQWLPLYEQEARSLPRYYPRMLLALPKPYVTTSTDGVLLKDSMITVNEEGKNAIHALGTYSRTKGVFHDDGSFSLASIPISNTSDDIRIRGYYVFPRSLDVPNPLNGHPFLASNKPSKVLTDEPFNDVFPTVEAIMTHGVPQTNDPYGEGLKYAKLYDVKLSQIPWASWSAKFPPVDPILATPEIKTVSFPDTAEEPAPSKSLQDGYTIPWYAGISPRLWLMTQEDAGVLVTKMLLSKTSDAGVVPPETPGERPVAKFPESSPDDCFTYESFDEFLNAGFFRFKYSGPKRENMYPMGFCVPTSYIVTERQAAITAGKTAWKDSTEFDLVRDHVALLKKFQPVIGKQKVPVYEKIVGKGEAELRRTIRTLLDDPERTPDDKYSAIRLLIRDLTPSNEVYYDRTDLFVICSHTLAILTGELESDRQAYYAKWTAIDEGYRACKFCGEQINKDVLVAQDDFDDSGNVVINYDVLPTDVFHGTSHVESFSNSLRDLQKVFIMDNPAEAVLYLCLSVLQVLPVESQVLPVLQTLRGLSAVLKSNKKIGEKEKDKIEGILGVAGTVILLQTHNPFLIPRRSFGSRVLKFTGFPRDTEDSADSPVLDTLINVLRSTLEAMPNTFKGPISVVLRLAITKPKELRTEAVKFIGQLAGRFKTALESAKERYVAPPEETVVNSITLPLMPITKTEFAPTEKVGEESFSECSVPQPRSVITGKLLPSLVQQYIELWKNIVPGKTANSIEVELELLEMTTIEKKDIERRISLGFPKLKLPKVEEFLKQKDSDGVDIGQFISRILDLLDGKLFPLETVAEYREQIVTLQTRIGKSLVRDAMKGLAFQLFHEIASNPNKDGLVAIVSTAIQKDLTLNMIMITKDMAQRQELELRARERETFKQRMRTMNDTEREITKRLLDIGIAPYIITNEDRELFSKEYKYRDPEQERLELEKALDSDSPEEGFGTTTNNKDNGDELIGPDGMPRLDDDRGDYGDLDERDQNDYSTTMAMQYDADNV